MKPGSTGNYVYVTAISANAGPDALDFAFGPCSDYPDRYAAVHTEGLRKNIDGSDSVWAGDSPPTPVPEPATVLLIGSGLVGLAGFRKRFRKGWGL